MATCKTCGGDNASGKARCQYCDQPLQELRTLEVDWEVRTGDGATGRGRVRVQAPTTVGVEPTRAAVEAAFGATMTALGSSATAAQAQPLMAERLPALLPPGHVFESITVEAVSAFVLVGRAVAPGHAHQPHPTSGGSGCGFGCVALLLGLCCVSSGLLSVVVGFLMTSDVERMRSAQVLSAAEASRATGYVCVESVVASIDTGAPVAVDGAVCLWLSERDARGRDVVSSVPALRVGPLEVRPDALTSWDNPATFTPRVDGVVHTYKAIKADQPVTILGTVDHGVIAGGSGSAVSTRLSRNAIADHLAEVSKAGRIGGTITLVLGAMFLVLWRLASRQRANA